MGIPYVFTGSAALFDQAKHALQTIDEKKVFPREHGQRDAIIAVVFSALALEAFINEVGDLAASPRASGPNDPPSVSAMGTVLQEVEEGRGSVQLKYQMAKLILSGTVYDKSQQPYQDFRMLVSLRDALAHIKRLGLYEITDEGLNPLSKPPNVIGQLRSRKLLADVSGLKQPVGWIEELESLVTARWACTTTAEMIWSVIETIPDSPFQGYWRAVYRKYYDLTEPPMPR